MFSRLSWKTLTHSVCILLSQSGVAHGCITTQSVVRLYGDWKLLDFECAGYIQQTVDQKIIYAGETAYDGTLPPEMFCKLDADGVEEYEKYWSEEKGICGDAWRDFLKPRTTSRSK